MYSVAEHWRPYQHQALAFLQRTPRAYLAAKAGAGKTAIALRLIQWLLVDELRGRRALIVCPKRIAPQWPREALKWDCGQGLTFVQYTGTQEARLAALRLPGAVVVCSFEYLAELIKQIPLKQWPFDLVVFDEADRLRKGGRQGSVGWRAMNAVARKTTTRIVLMSGTPRPGTAHELYAPVYLLDGGKALGQTLGGFRADYLEPAKMDRSTGRVFSWQLRAGKESALYGAIEHLYFGVAPDLGLPFVEIDRRVAMPPVAAELYRELSRDKAIDIAIDIAQLELTAASAGTLVGKLHQMGQGAVFSDDGAVAVIHEAKLDEVAEILAEIDGPALLAIWYQHDRERVLRRFAKQGAVDITTPEGLKAALRGDVSLGVIHPQAAGHGIDGLQRHYADLIWFCLPHSAGLYEQVVARLVRSGQQSTVRVWRVICGKVDEKILVRLAEKQAEQGEFFRHLERSRSGDR